jgi:hypothetical protein
MARFALLLSAAAALVAGCTPTRTVHVDTFSRLTGPLPQGTAIYVSADPNSPNPILAETIAAKLRTLLQERGYTPAGKRQDAGYMLTFRAGIDSARVLGYAPTYRPYGAYYGFGGWHHGFGYGYSTYVPYIETVYAHWLETRLYPQGENAKGPPQPVWIGNAVVGLNTPELRTAINYLLVGFIEYFATDTQRWVRVRLKQDDPRVLGLAEIR